MKTSKVFKLARASIASGHDRFICIAIVYGPGSVRDRSRAKQVITTRMGRVGDSGTLERWLENAGIPAHAQSALKMQAYRLRWLDTLIEEFETKGD